MKALILLLLLQIPARTLEIKPGDFPQPGPQEYRLIHESQTVAVFLYVVPDKSLDARCVVVFPREGSLGWLIDRKENKAELFYTSMPWPAFCKEKKARALVGLRFSKWR